MVLKSLTSPGVADTDTFLINTWNTLLASYQQRVHKYTLATVKCQIEQVENTMSTVLITMEAVHVDNAIPLDHSISEVPVEEPEVGSAD